MQTARVQARSPATAPFRASQRSITGCKSRLTASAGAKVRQGGVQAQPIVLASQVHTHSTHPAAV